MYYTTVFHMELTAYHFSVALMRFSNDQMMVVAKAQMDFSAAVCSLFAVDFAKNIDNSPLGQLKAIGFDSEMVLFHIFL